MKDDLLSHLKHQNTHRL